MIIERALVVEQDRALRAILEETLKKGQFDVTCLEGQEALNALEQPFDLVLCEVADQALLKAAKASNPDAIVILITDTRHLDKAVEGMRLGAFSYLLKPFTADTVEAMLEKAEEHEVLLQQNSFLKKEIATVATSKRHQIIAESSIMKAILSDVSKIAKSHASVFISGESGTGKEVIAHAIHYQSLRATGSFIRVNCAAIPEALLESEFFGHEKGSFTGALSRKLGRFELADKGTLLLDEISETPIELQPKLLRAIQEQEFERVGGTRSIRVDVRLVSTSNRNMKEAVDLKLFREDLYYRLNVVPIHLPPLRDRKDDILPLAEYFLSRFCEENHKNRLRLSHEARKKLLDYHWPGNIRELANVIERAVVMTSSDLIETESLKIELPLATPKEAPAAPLPTFVGLTLQEVEKRLILDTLAANNQNRTKTAQVLGISIRTLRNKLKEYCEKN